MLIQMHVRAHTHTYKSSVLVCGGVNTTQVVMHQHFFFFSQIMTDTCPFKLVSALVLAGAFGGNRKGAYQRQGDPCCLSIKTQKGPCFRINKHREAVNTAFLSFFFLGGMRRPRPGILCHRCGPEISDTGRRSRLE